jgi:hypothetical protein
MRRALTLAIVALTACSTKTVTASSAASSPSLSPTAAPCVSREEAISHIDKVSAQLAKAKHAIDRVDYGGAVEPLRLVVSEMRSMADQFQVVSPEVQQHLLRAADAIDSAASAYNDFDANNGNSYLGEGTHEINQVVASIDQSMYC